MNSDEEAGTTIDLEVNGRRCQAEVSAPEQVLADYLRDELGAHDVKIACREGACGACTVLLGGEAVPSCLVYLARADGSTVRTPADLAETQLGTSIVEALVQSRAIQCGFCTPGIVTALYGLLAAGTVEIAADDLRGHLCRCTGYQRILDAARTLSAVSTSGASESAVSAAAQS